MDENHQPAAPLINIRRLYDRFDAPVIEGDCGKLCAPHNPNDKPFCCDICHSVPAAYQQEWTYLQASTDLWHIWGGGECTQEPIDPQSLLEETPEHMLLLACLGPEHCQRPYRAQSCRQFPFFPYITANDRFIGLAYNWDFEPQCWVISNLGAVTQAFREEFVRVYDELLAYWEAEFDSYAVCSEDMRLAFAARKQRIPLLHRNGGYYLISPVSERMERVKPEQFRRFGPYK